jgi:hypothetical protein
MLKVRQAQFAEIERVRVEGFLLEHVAAFFPEQCAALGSEGTLEAVRHGLAGAVEHGLAEPVDACAFVDVMFLFGREFAVNPELTWVPPALEGARAQPPGSRGAWLYAEALRVLEQMVETGA